MSVGPDGQAWVINSYGNIYARARGGSTNSYADGNWSLLSGAASDVGVGADGSVFVIGTNATVGGFGLWKLVSATWQAVAGFNGGLRVAVDSAGNPVVVDKSGIVSFYQPSSNAWQALATSSTGLDIGVGNA